jgi:predicted ATPase/DNA-binding CsgD family transcriptional regulator
VLVEFVDLSAVSDPDLVLPTIARGVARIPEAAPNAMETLIALFTANPRLLVLDNCEHVLEVAAELGALLTACPDLSILATSRAPLRLSCEHEFPVAPLATPPADTGQPVAYLAKIPAVALFLDRAQHVQPNFQVTNENAPDVAELVRRLDGLPLAIELAAARVRILSPRAILRRLHEPLALLTGGPQNWPPRHRTLRATIAWSYGLLSPDEQRFFRRLGVFAGGCTEEAAMHVCSDDCDDSATLDCLALLVEHSLLECRPTANGEPRFRMLESLRVFALEELRAHVEEAGTRHRHATYFLELCKAIGPQFGGGDQARSLDQLEFERDNIREVFEWSCAHQAGDIALQLSASMWRLWLLRGPLLEGYKYLDLALATAGDVDPGLRATVLNAAGGLASNADDYKRANQLYSEALGLFRTIGDEPAAAMVLSNLGNVALDQGQQDEAIALWNESLALRERLQDNRGIAIVMSNLANVSEGCGEYAEARRLHEESRRRFAALGDTWAEAVQMDHLGSVAYHEGAHRQAERLHRESAQALTKLGDRRGSAKALRNLSRTLLALGEPAHAAKPLKESLALLRELGDVLTLTLALETAANLASVNGEPARSARLLGAAAVGRARCGSALLPVDAQEFEGVVARIRQELGQSSFSTAWAVGQVANLDEVVSEAIASTANTQAAAASARLTRRERQVAELIASGMTDRQIATELVITEGTAGVHVVNILNKLGFHSRTQVAAWIATQDSAPGQGHSDIDAH